MQYAQLARRLGTAFIQLLEPKAVGHYAGKAVGLPVAQQKILKDFYLKLNYSRAYQHLPMVVYYDYQRRRAGCGISWRKRLRKFLIHKFYTRLCKLDLAGEYVSCQIKLSLALFRNY